jgi:hypothetical protein
MPPDLNQEKIMYLLNATMRSMMRGERRWLLG